MATQLNGAAGAAQDTPGAAVSTLVPLAAVVEDAKLWPRRELDGERVKEFGEMYAAGEGDTLPAVQLAPVPATPATAGGKKNGASGAAAAPDTSSPRFYIVDGWHRIAGMRRADKSKTAKIPAIIRADLTTADAIYTEAVRLSSTSSKPLTSREKREAVRRILAAHPEKSDREIARLAGCTHQTVSNQRNGARRFLSRLGDALTADVGGDAGGAYRTPAADRSIEERLWAILTRTDAGELRQDALAAALADAPELRPMARRWGAIIYNAAQQQTQPARQN